MTDRHVDDDESDIRFARERAWREVADIDAAHERGEIDDAGWHAAMARLVVPAYLAATNVRGGSGHSGSADDWEWSRGILADAFDRDGSFLDIGCANGLLMESAERWAAARGLRLEPHGLDIAPELAALARRRLPRWAARIHVGNAMGWRPAERFDIVRVGLEYVPFLRRRALVSWLLDEVVAPGGRLVLGKVNELVEARELESSLAAWGFRVAGRAERPHRSEPRLAYRIAWIDSPRPHPRAGALRLRSLRRTDFPLLRRWLNEPHVREWWRGPLDDAGVEAKYGPHVDGVGRTRHFIAEDAGRAVGFAQWYRWSDYVEHSRVLGLGPNEAGLDLLIGEPDALGRGLGARIIARLTEDVIFAFDDIVACASDPEAANGRSLGAFRRAGFAEVRRFDDPGDGRTHVVMRRARQSR